MMALPEWISYMEGIITRQRKYDYLPSDGVYYGVQPRTGNTIFVDEL